MRRFLIVAVVTLTLASSALAGEIPTVGLTGEIPTGGLTYEMTDAAVDLIQMLLGFGV